MDVEPLFILSVGGGGGGGGKNPERLLREGGGGKFGNKLAVLTVFSVRELGLANVSEREGGGGNKGKPEFDRLGGAGKEGCFSKI